MSNRVKRFLLFGLPILLWMAVILIGSSTWGNYTNSWKLMQEIVPTLAPEVPQPAPDGNGLRLTLNMYGVNIALRRITHIVLYAILAALIVRGIQGGERRLKGWSMAGALGISILYVGADELYRHFTPQRHAKWLDLVLNLIGVFLVLSGTVVWFGFKNLEYRLLHPERDDAPADATPTAETAPDGPEP